MLSCRAENPKCGLSFRRLTIKKAVCNICKAEVASSGGTTNMSTHLRRHHQIDTSVTTLPTPVLKTVYQPVHQVLGPNPDMVSPSTSATTNTVNPWKLSSKGKLPAAKSNTITNAVVNYIIQDMRPFSTTESSAIRNMLAALDPRYKPPSRHTIAETLIPALVDQVKHVLQTDLDQATAVALTSDAWTSRSADSYLTITCHYLKDWSLESKVLQIEHFHGSHTGENVGLELKSALSKWNIVDKVKVVTVDNASNMNVAIRVSGVELKLGCFAHTLNLASQALSIPVLGRVLSKIRSIVTFFHKSCIGTEYLKQKQSALGLPPNKLVMDCKTRWNSSFNMLQRFLKQRPAVLATLLDERKKSVSAKANITGMSDADISVCEEFVKEMEVMVTSTLVLSEEKTPIVGLILPLLEMLRNHFTPNPDDTAFTKALKQAVGCDLAVRCTEPALLFFFRRGQRSGSKNKKQTLCPRGNLGPNLGKVSCTTSPFNYRKAGTKPSSGNYAHSARTPNTQLLLNMYLAQVGTFCRQHGHVLALMLWTI